MCFAAGTPVETADGSILVENVRAGDKLLARSEFDPAGEATPRAVEEVFVRFGAVWRLAVGGRDVFTTPEHPFFEAAKGWVPCQELAVGDRLLCRDGSWVAVGAVEDTGRWETVYNFRIAEDHTYFVGCPEWGFGVWAHNLYREYWAAIRDHVAVLGMDKQQANAILNYALKAHTAEAAARRMVNSYEKWGVSRSDPILHDLIESGLARSKFASQDVVEASALLRMEEMHAAAGSPVGMATPRDFLGTVWPRDRTEHLLGDISNPPGGPLRATGGHTTAGGAVRPGVILDGPDAFGAFYAEASILDRHGVAGGGYIGKTNGRMFPTDPIGLSTFWPDGWPISRNVAEVYHAYLHQTGTVAGLRSGLASNGMTVLYAFRPPVAGITPFGNIRTAHPKLP